MTGYAMQALCWAVLGPILGLVIHHAVKRRLTRRAKEHRR